MKKLLTMVLVGTMALSGTLALPHQAEAVEIRVNAFPPGIEIKLNNSETCQLIAMGTLGTALPPPYRQIIEAHIELIRVQNRNQRGVKILFPVGVPVP